MSEAFYDYVRGRSDVVPSGHSERGLRAYRHLVWLGASQVVEAHHPALRSTLGEDAWRTLIAAFVRDSAWTSHYYADLVPAFEVYVAQLSQGESDTP